MHAQLNGQVTAPLRWSCRDSIQEGQTAGPVHIFWCSPPTTGSVQQNAEIPPEWDPDGKGGGSGSKNISVPKAYNELATLMSVPGELCAAQLSGQYAAVARHMLALRVSGPNASLLAYAPACFNLRMPFATCSATASICPQLLLCFHPLLPPQARMPFATCSAAARTASLATPPSL